MNRQWVCTDAIYFALLALGYVTAQIETHGGRRWRLMVLP